MSADALIASLMDIHPRGFDLSLDRIEKLLDRLGNPHRDIPPVIHVAGTNGKGSTIAFARAILEAAGKRVHVDTSPHLVSWHERFRLGAPGGGKLVEDAVLEHAIARVADANAGQAITVYEILTAAMFLLFRENPADYCLVEVGLGGRFDSTNVIENPAVCVIAPVDMDHQAYLGDTLAKIAFEKAGIIKPGVPVVVGIQHDEALEVIERRAAELGCRTFVCGRDFDYHQQAGRFIYQDLNGLLDLPNPALVGVHQLANASLAIAAVRSVGLDFPNEVFERAMETVYWPGRLQPLKQGNIPALLPQACDIWLDGGHNPAAGKVLCDALATRRKEHPLTTYMVCGMLTTKEAGGYFSAVASVVDRLIAVPIQSSDAGFTPEQLAQAAAREGIDARPAQSLDHGLEELNKLLKGKPARVVFAGSLYLAGDVLAFNGTPPQ